MENISKHITYKEATFSNTAIRKGITNAPSPEQLANMKVTANEVFEPARVFFNEPIMVTSFYRSRTLNREIGSGDTSDHINGRAIDHKFSNGSQRSNAELFYFHLNNSDFDQLIWEFGNDSEPSWVHISYRGSSNRKQVLIAKRVQGVVKYIPFM